MKQMPITWRDHQVDVLVPETPDEARETYEQLNRFRSISSPDTVALLVCVELLLAREPVSTLGGDFGGGDVQDGGTWS